MDRKGIEVSHVRAGEVATFMSGDEGVVRMGDDEWTGEGTRRPRILLLTERAPGFDSGFGMRVLNTIEGLAAAGDLHVCLVDGSVRGERLAGTPRYSTSRVAAQPIRRWQKVLSVSHPRPANIRYRRVAELRTSINRRHGAVDWDLIWCCRVRVHQLTNALRSRAIIVDFDDVGDRLLRSAIRDRISQEGFVRTLPRNVYDWIDSWKWRRFQRETARRVDHVAVCSGIDVEHLGITNAVVVPNGYALPDESPLGTASTRPLHEPVPSPPRDSLIFVGPLTYTPNRLAVKWLLDRVLPRVQERIPDAELVVVGAAAGVAAVRGPMRGVRFTGWVDDVAPFYRSAGVAVTPLHSGGGTRLKVIEALARRVPLVSTSFGSEGLDLRAGHELLVADDPNDFAAACVSILQDPNLRQRLVTAGWRRYLNGFTSADCSRAVTDLALATIGQTPRDDDRRPESDVLI